ncbi:hypothetical protein [Nitrosarchaeum sp. AC2]|uniref:hypothetical protein n=1 Tax=Nitrosarchaeum sp. AC2 TaxID=2259673 RepID=UPI0015C7B7CB|nr:hypothetical protein [Nitrosarchaeum sp. AC2]QLH11260.1 hypothetical protein DSQ20_07150 [Nitrosarchaeum sp. AC2]
MSKSNSKDSETEQLKKIQADIEQIKNDMRDTTNNVEFIKGNTRNIDRILTLSNLPTIINDLKNIIGTSEIKAAVLHLTEEKISAGELSSNLGIDPKNLTKFVTPFVDKKSYISEIKVGTTKFFQRQDIIDSINFEAQEPFKSLLTSWREKQNKKQNNQSEQKSEQETHDSSNKVE